MTDNKYTSVAENVSSKEFDDKVSFIHNEHDEFIKWDRKNRERCFENLRMYSGIDSGQYPASYIDKYNAEKRHCFTANIARTKVNGLAGSLLTNRYDWDFLPIEGLPNQLTHYIKVARDADKELLDWSASQRELVINGLIYRGDQEMYISDEYNELGNIGFRTLSMGHLTFDPQWISDRPKECRRAIKDAYMTAARIAETYSRQSDAIKAAVLMDERKGSDFGPNEGVILHKNLDPMHGNQYQVIEYYEVKDVKMKVEKELTSGLTLPKTDDKLYKIQWLNMMAPYWSPETVTEEFVKDKVLWLTVICPALDKNLILEDRPHEIQIKRLPFFPWAAARINGEWSGIIDLIKDPQRAINYRESLITYIIQTSAFSGKIVDPAIFNDKPKMDELKRRYSDPSYMGEGRPNFSKNLPNPILTLRTNPDINPALNQLERMYDIADRVSMQPAVSDARSEGGKEPSGILYAQKTKRAEINLYVMMESLRQQENDKGEAYLYQAPIQYGNQDYEREFTVFSTKERIVLNKRTDLSDGSVRIENRIKEIPRHKVIITESLQGETRKMTTLMVSSDLLTKIPPENTGTRQILTSKLVEANDVFDDQDKEELKEMRVLEVERAKAQLKRDTAILQSETVRAKLEAQQAMLMAQEGQPAGGEALPAAKGGKATRIKPPAKTGRPTPGASIEKPSMAQVGGGRQLKLPI